MNAEEYLRQDLGAQLTALLFQNAVLKAEVDRLKAEVEASRPSAPPSGPLDDNLPSQRERR